MDAANSRAMHTYLYGGEGKDTLIAGDAVFLTFHNGGLGNDVLRGGPGQDDLLGAEGNDLADGGPGIDYVVYDRRVRVDLRTGRASGGSGADRFRAIEGVQGSDWADTLLGDARANRLVGNWGNDVLIGRGGNDVLGDLHDDNGNDRMFGGVGNDAVRGGPGHDRLVGAPGGTGCSEGGEGTHCSRATGHET